MTSEKLSISQLSQYAIDSAAENGHTPAELIDYLTNGRPKTEVELLRAKVAELETKLEGKVKQTDEGLHRLAGFHTVLVTLRRYLGLSGSCPRAAARRAAKG